LVEGFESSFGLELLSTVHWVLTHEKPRSRDALVAGVYGWNEHKKCFSRRQIALAADVMVEKGWPTATASRAFLLSN
ncbi:MAG: Appr-1-p processing protein, partial [Cyanobacteria bacterium MAG CAR2_bin_4]|nr:Appr-1-p processing protein [Cyanobacteria bacterium MAG CAR2_bin_4]